MTHKCAIPDCGISIPKRMLMCRAHWAVLSKHFRTFVWNCYRRRERSPEDKNRHLTTCAEAVRIVVAAPKEHQQDLLTTPQE